MKYLTPQKVLAIHFVMIKKFGGSQGLRDINLLESAAARPKASFDGQDLYPDIFSKAAALIHSLLKNHPFVDGNKRTALASCGIFLKMNGYELVEDSKKEVAFALSVENEKLKLEGIGTWLSTN